MALFFQQEIQDMKCEFNTLFDKVLFISGLKVCIQTNRDECFVYQYQGTYSYS